MLDNVIDYNYYNVPQARKSNLRHRPVGLGIMGFQDALFRQRIPYASEQGLEFADRSMEAVSYFAIQACSDLAAERGRYSSYQGSLWSHGILPIDSLKLLAEGRGGYLQVDDSQHPGLGRPARAGPRPGMRNSNTMAIAPTATISNICGVSQSIEPTYQNLFVKSNLSGEFTVVNPYLVRDLKARDLWDSVMVNDLKYYDGSSHPIDRIPDDLKAPLRHRLRDRPPLAGGGRQPAPEMDRPGPVAQPLHERAQRQEARQPVQAGLGARAQDHLLPAVPGRHPRGEVHHGRCEPGQPAERRGGQLYRPGQGERKRQGQRGAAPKACSILDPECEACQ